MEVNQIYNSHFTGSNIWNLFGRECGKLESTYNRSVKIMCDLPYETHRYFIEPLTRKPHLKKTLIRRYLKFIQSIQNSKKSALRHLLNMVMYDVRSTTGLNLRMVMLMLDRTTIDGMEPWEADSIDYHKVDDEEAWRIGLAQELIDCKSGVVDVPGFQSFQYPHLYMYVMRGCPLIDSTIRPLTH